MSEKRTFCRSGNGSEMSKSGVADFAYTVMMYSKERLRAARLTWCYSGLPLKHGNK